MKQLRNIMLITGCIALLFASSCKKKEIKGLEEDKAALQADKDKLQSELDYHHCAYGAIKPGHDLEGYKLTSGTVSVWMNTETEPTNTSSGYDIGPVAGSLSKDSSEVAFFVDGLPLGIHWIQSACGAIDSMGMSQTIGGGKAVEILAGEHCAPKAHIHAE